MEKDTQMGYIFSLIKERDPKGLELLYEKHFRQIYGVAFSVLKDEGKSHDVVQNVMIKLYQLKIEQFPKNHELSWLYRVTKNEALQVLRKQKDIVNMDAIPEGVMLRSNIDDYVDMHNYYSLIESLNEKQKHIVTLKVLGGLSHREIAELLNMRIGTVQWIYNTSIKKLRTMLSGLSIVTVMSGGVFAARIMRYIQNSQNQVLELEIFKPERLPASDINSVIIWGIVFVLCIFAVMIFFKKSDKIPTNK